MRRRDKKIEDRSELDEIIREGEYISLAMINGDKPYIVPLSYGYKEGIIYVHSAKEGQKIDLIGQNENVSFEIVIQSSVIEAEKACNWTCHYKSVIGSGKAYIIEDFDEKTAGLNAIMEHYGSENHSYPDSAVNKTAVIRIDIEEISGKKSPA